MGVPKYHVVSIVAVGLFLATPAAAAPFFFSTGDPDGRMATASRPASPGKIEIESADDFILSSPTKIIGGTFTGLLPSGVPLSSIGQVRVEIYRVFPKDSTNPPSGHVPTRVNSPSDVAFADRDGTSGLSFTATSLGSFSVANTVMNGIHPIPNQTTGGEGPASGSEVLFDLSLANPLSLSADHYFFIPQVEVAGGDFLWLSVPKPITGGTGPFTPDLQAWIRNEDLAPDWLRVGTDIVGPGTTGGPAPTFDAAFSLRGETVPEPSTVALFVTGGLALWALRRRVRVARGGGDLYAR